MITTLKEQPQNVDKFKEIYAEDRFKARIYAFEKSPSIHIVNYNNVEPGVFQIFDNSKRFGVSKTLKLFASNKCNKKYIVNKTKFYKHENGKLFPLMIENIEKEYLPIFIEHFSWVRFVSENHINGITFNTIVRNKLYSRDKLLRFMFGCSADKAMSILKQFTYREWKWYKKSITNTENLNLDLFKDRTVFEDTVKLAYKMNEFVNLSWSQRRLKEQHDKWSKEYTDLAFELSNRPLLIHPIYILLSEYLNCKILSTTKELAIEGMTQKHCVATYSNHVDSGRSAILHINGYTAEISNTGKSLYLRQFKGYRNNEAPDSLRLELEGKISEFNSTKTEADFKLQTQEQKQVFYEDINLPF